MFITVMSKMTKHVPVGLKVTDIELCVGSLVIHFVRRNSGKTKEQCPYNKPTLNFASTTPRRN